MLLADIKEVIKASPAIQIQNRITHLQRRAWNVLLANAYHELADKDIHCVSMVELAAKLGFDSKNDAYLKGMIKSLVDCTIEWNILGKNNKQVWGAASLLGSAEIENGVCTYSFAAHLRHKLHNPLMYTRLNLRLQNQFKSQYALILWEVCFDYYDPDRGEGETPFIPIKTFRELMGVEGNEYPLFGELNRNVIKPAIKEINALTDYHVEVETKRIGRKIGELKFRIQRVKQLPVQESLFPEIDNLPPVALELVQASVDRNIALQISVKPSTPIPNSLTSQRNAYNPTSSANASKNTQPRCKPTRKAAWSKQRLMPYSPQSSVKTYSQPSKPHTKTKKHAS